MLHALVALNKGSKDIQKFMFVFYIQMLVPYWGSCPQHFGQTKIQRV